MSEFCNESAQPRSMRDPLLPRVVTLLTSVVLRERDEHARWILAENFIPGVEVAVEGLLTNGVLQPLAIFDKPDPLNGPFFEETIYVTPSRLSADVQQDIIACAARTAEALGLREGPVHGEFRVNEKGVWVIELAARAIGGHCSSTLSFASRMSLGELSLRPAPRIRPPPPPNPPPKPQATAAEPGTNRHMAKYYSRKGHRTTLSRD